MQIPRLPLSNPLPPFGDSCENVVFFSRTDKVQLKGWFVPGSSESVLVIVHGGFQNRVDSMVGTLALARDLVNRGYSVLLFDLRGRGESAGKGLSLTSLELDIGGAYDFLKESGYQAGDIGIVGFCSGAAGASIFASREQIGGLVLNGCFAGVKDMFYNQAAARGIPKVLVDVFLPGVHLAARVFYGYKIVNPVDVIGNVRCPVFFIHEENDNLVSTVDSAKLAAASDNPGNAAWEVNGTAHSWAYQTYRQEYVERIDTFFKMSLSNGQSPLKGQ